MSKTVLVFCEPEDICGLWLVTEIAKRNYSVEHILPDELAIGSLMSVYVTNHGDIVEVSLADGRSFDSSNLLGVVNRMNRFPRPMLDGVSDRDAVYMCEEMRAAIMTWFAGLACPVLNPPTPYSANGLIMHDSYWRHCASMLGIKSATVRLTADNLIDLSANYSVVVIGEEVFVLGESQLPMSIVSTSRSLANSLGFGLLGLDFNISFSGEWEFLRANIMPDLMSFGSSCVDSLLTYMVTRC